MITGKELFGEIKKKKKFLLSRRSIFSESGLKYMPIMVQLGDRDPCAVS